MPASVSPPAPELVGAHPAQRWLLERMRRLTEFNRRHPWLLDLVVVAVVLAFSLPDIAGGGHGVQGQVHHGLDQRQRHIPQLLATLCMVALLVPLWWRRRAPGVAFAIVTVVLLVEWSIGVWIRTDISLVVVLYALAVHGSLRALARAAGITVGVLTAGVYGLRLPDEHPSTVLVLMAGTCTAGAAIGLTVRTRRAYLVALEERAVRLEAERDQRVRLSAAQERARIARQMHDVVGHHIAVVVGLADGGATLAANRGEQAAEPLRLIAETGRQAMGELRRVLGVLRDDGEDAQLRPQPGIADLDGLVGRVRAAGLAVTYHSSGDLGGLSQGVQLAVYRIVQEALTNTLKHAGATSTATVLVAAADGRVEVRVVDTGAAGPRPGRRTTGGGDGRFGPAEEVVGHGAVGIRERASLYEGNATIGPDPGGSGWLVEVVMFEPLPSQRRPAQP